MTDVGSSSGVGGLMDERIRWRDLRPDNVRAAEPTPDIGGALSSLSQREARTATHTYRF